MQLKPPGVKRLHFLRHLDARAVEAVHEHDRSARMVGGNPPAGDLHPVARGEGDVLARDREGGLHIFRVLLVRKGEALDDHAVDEEVRDEPKDEEDDTEDQDRQEAFPPATPPPGSGGQALACGNFLLRFQARAV